MTGSTFRGKFHYDAKTWFGIGIIIAYYLVANAIILDFTNLQPAQYKILFYINCCIVMLFGFYKDDEPLSFARDDSVEVTSHAQIKVAFHVAVTCFSIWFILIEEFVYQMHYNAFSGLAVIALFISFGRLITFGASKYENKDQSLYMDNHKSIRNIIIALYFFGTLVGMTIIEFGEWYMRWQT